LSSKYYLYFLLYDTVFFYLIYSTFSIANCLGCYSIKKKCKNTKIAPKVIFRENIIYSASLILKSTFAIGQFDWKLSTEKEGIKKCHQRLKIVVLI